MLESTAVAEYYPDLADRAVGKHGNSLGWRRNRIRAKSGLIVDALGLDVAARGAKLDQQRPDLIIFDDVDDSDDSLPTIKKNEVQITQKILPAGSNDVAVLFIQNIVHYESIAARLAGLASESADYLATRKVIGPTPAIHGLRYERERGSTRWIITGGTPTWLGQDLAICQSQIDDMGLKAFLAEAQHVKTPPEGQAFPKWDRSVHVIPKRSIPASWTRCVAVDYGFGAPFCALWIARTRSGALVVYRELYERGWTAAQQAFHIRTLSAGEDIKYWVGDPSMWAKMKEGKRFKSSAEQYRDAKVPLQKATNDRIPGWDLVREYMDWEPPDEEEEYNGFEPRLFVMDNCVNLIRTLPEMVKDAHKPDDIDTDLEDHAVDALRYGVVQLASESALAGAFSRALRPQDDDIGLPAVGGELMPAYLDKARRKGLSVVGYEDYEED